ncbi:MAG: 4-hydroxybenzoate octaprenyltransferase [Gammaproteobacteria bacterium]|nr:4-hydroxybenzoate octaprenyltransferase [Gammaproteobacteria bacterium]MYA37136.1 4-hydroxybenzoate octaprenyltransferase [Gammaproteobacteria bacterium]MYH86959.1 4-hydroxybenzoate octaprenyltransferase [Gammaproteobacteria bacterium]MYK05871.1 4-hydroxybenzoate octaprenyltransferase [Gammaproteobacteria bacterium]
MKRFLERTWRKLSPWIKERLEERPELRRKAIAYYYLVRLHRPVGIYLLLWPTIGALWLAAGGIPSFGLLFIFVSGTVVMRSAGCCINDFADYHIDGEVLRTRERPLATGQLSRRDALHGFVALSLAGFVLVLFTNLPTILLAIAAIPIIALYPFLKRVTHMPQVALGVAFSWGILMAFTAQTGGLPTQAWLLFLANCLWTVVYDTQYAMVDREYDRRLGMKSTAILFGDSDNMMIGLLQVMFIAAMWLAGRQFDLGLPYFLSLVGASLLFAWQQILTSDRQPEACFRAFVNNQWVGALVFLGIVLG